MKMTLSGTNAMHPLFQKASGLTETAIAAAIEVHRHKGPGLIESTYEWCMIKELELRGFSTEDNRVNGDEKKFSVFSVFSCSKAKNE